MTDNSYPNGPDTVEFSAATTAGTAEPKLAEQEKAQVDSTAQLQLDLEAVREESERWRDKFLRKAAELENFRKRVEKEQKDWTVQAKSSVMLELLPVLDACERAMSSFDEVSDAHQGLDQYKRGVELLYKQLSSTLARLGVVRISAVGEKFDPNLHEALTHLQTTDYEENTVISELSHGYTFEGRLLRPVQVVVAMRPKLEHPSGQ